MAGVLVLDGGSISIPAGITVGLLASFVQSLGLTIQRKSHVINQSLPEQERRVEHRRPLWLLGFGIFISSNLFGSIFQIASLPVVILAPLGAVSLLWNAVFARLLLGDVFSPWMIIGTLLIAGGAVLIAIFGIVPEPTHSLEDLLMLFNRTAFIAYFSLLGFAVFVSLVTTHIVEYSYTRRVSLPDVSPPLSPLLAPSSAPSMLTTATTAANAVVDPSERTPLIDRKPHSRSRSKSSSPSTITSIHSMVKNKLRFSTSTRTPVLLAASYASFSGIISGMCLIFAKSGVELLMLTIAGDNQFWRWQAWVLVLSLAVCALLQLWYMHKSLVLADPTLVCPLAFCFYNLSSILNSLVYFDQFALLSTAQLLFVLLGIFVLLAGVWVVSFPASGYGIDIGTWNEDEDTELEDATGASPIRAFADSDSEESEHETHDDEPLPMHAHRRAHTLPAANESHSLHIVTQPPTPVEPELEPARARSRTHAPLSPGEGRSRSTFRPASTSSGSLAMARGHRRSTLGGAAASQSPPPPFPNPLSPSTSTLAGFSIGLSPVSPGFTLVPKERRRRGGGGAVRRAVSEGDAGAEEGEEGAHGEDERGALLPGASQPRRAKARWRWVRNVFSSIGR
ncbi:hypothetical protein B0H21DRAFT_874997 [Amylocystis lapponica]|nr:hypothetical protein B0H21DRAFT_874997 [Amylocystis lapponica]